MAETAEDVVNTESEGEDTATDRGFSGADVDRVAKQLLKKLGLGDDGSAGGAAMGEATSLLIAVVMFAVIALLLGM